MDPLFLPFRHTLRNRFMPSGKISLRTLAIAAFGVLLFVALFLLSHRVLSYFHHQSELGIILSLKIFQMSWSIIFFMLIFSSMVSGVSALFLSNDNDIFCSVPISMSRLYRMRYPTTTLFTSWMIVIFTLPVFGAYGVVFDAGVLFWPLMLLSVLSITATGSGIGLAFTIALVNLFPARRTKDIVFYLTLLFGILLYMVIRLMRPEDLADPERFPDFIEYLSAISAPGGPFLPADWASGLLSKYLQFQEIDPLFLGLILLTPFVCYYSGEWIMERWFIPGYAKALESFGGYHEFRPGSYSSSSLKWFFRKEVRMFMRDSSEWSQLFLIGALVVVYLYNFKALPLDRSPMPTEYLTNLIAYANIGLTGFLTTSLCARFVYPAISAEGSGFGLIRTSPVSLSRYIFYKYIFYVIPFTILSLLLIIVSNRLLHIEGPMLWIGVVSGLIITWTAVAMALGFGAYYADFKMENRAAMLGGFGAILFLFSAVATQLLIIGLGSAPAYRLVRASLKNTQLGITDFIISTIVLIIIISGALTISILCVKKGLQHLEEKA